MITGIEYGGVSIGVGGTVGVGIRQIGTVIYFERAMVFALATFDIFKMTEYDQAFRHVLTGSS